MFWIPEASQDYILNKIKEANEQAICSAFPTTYFNAAHPNARVASTGYVVGDLVRPPVANGFIYECTVSGTTGSTDPGWGTSQNSTFADGTVTWKTHSNFALANTTRTSDEYVVSDYSAAGITGRSIVLPEKQNIVTHTNGDVAYMALICSTDKSVRYVAESYTTVGSATIESGRTTIFKEVQFIVTDVEEAA